MFLQVSNVKTCKWYNTSENNVKFNFASSYKENYTKLVSSKTITCTVLKLKSLTKFELKLYNLDWVQMK